MPTHTTTRLQLPLVAAGQALKYITINEALLALDSAVQLAVMSADTTAQPASPSDSDLYILPSGKSGAAWGAMANGAIACYRDGAWAEIAPGEGWIAFVRDADQLWRYSGGAWGVLAVADALLAHLAGAETFSGDKSFTGKILMGATGAPALKTTVIPNFVFSGAGVNFGMLTVRHTSPGAGGAQFGLASTRGTSETDYAVSQNNDGLGTIYFYGADGDELVAAANIIAQVDGVPGNNDMPGRITFGTTADGASTPSERLRIDSAGVVRPGADNAQTLGASTHRWAHIYGAQFRPGAGAPVWTSGAGSPESVLTAPVGSLYTRTDGGAGTTLYVKESGAGATGWAAK